MRSLEYLIQLFPDKTGKELLQLQELDKLADKKIFDQLHKASVALIDDININGGYYKGRFGLDQLFYYSFKNLRLIEGDIYADVKHIVCFFTNKGINIAIDDKEYQRFNAYGVDIYERVDKQQFDDVLKYISDTEKFWSHLHT